MMRVAAVLLALVLAAAVPACAGGTQVLSGDRVGAAAEEHVRQAVSPAKPDMVKVVYRVPDRVLPSGAVTLKPRWSRDAPSPGFQGRMVVPVEIALNGQRMSDVGVMVEVGSPTSGVSVRRGDGVTVSLVSGGGAIRVEMPGVIQQPGKIGEQVTVELRSYRRTVTARVVSPREVVVEPEP